MNQRDHDAGTAGTDGVAQSTGTAIDVDDGVVELELRHQRHRHHGKGFVDLPQIHVLHTPASSGKQLLHGTHRSGGKPVRLLRVGGVRHDAGYWPDTQACCGGCTQQHQCGGAVVDGRTGRCSDSAVLLERRLEHWNFVNFYLARTFVDRHHQFTGSGFDGDWRDLGGKSPRRRCCLRTLHAGHGEFVLRTAREVVLGGTVFAKGAHGATGLVGVFEAIEHHVVKNPVVPDTDAAAALEQQMRRVGHALHATCDHDVVATGKQHVVRHHGRLHARAAHLGQGHRSGAVGQTALERRLAGWRLALASHQAVAEQHFGHQLGRHARALHRGPDGGTAQVVCGQRRKVALEGAHGSAGSAHNNNRVGNRVCHGLFFRWD